MPRGSVRSGGSAQWQSIVPLDERGDVILVGGSDPAPPAGCQGREDWFVYDLSSSQPVLLDAINTGVTGFNIGVHSPRGSSVGFGVEGNVLAVYDGGFRTVSLPITALAVWAASPTEVWIGGGSVAAGRIVKDDGSPLEWRNGSPASRTRKPNRSRALPAIFTALTWNCHCAGRPRNRQAPRRQIQDRNSRIGML